MTRKILIGVCLLVILAGMATLFLIACGVSV